jgi:DNA-binding transcriptional MerR regulator
MRIPGTVIPETDGRSNAQFLNGIFAATSSLMLSQIREMTGLDASALQNWVKRGWVSPPQNRRYNVDQVARILIINMLREALQHEKIAFLLSYGNGSVMDRLDDIIPESKLYEYICTVAEEYRGKDVTDSERLRAAIEKVTADYVETTEGASQRLRKALEIIIIAGRSIQVKRRADRLLDEIYS